jgi:hypothetical protein
MARSDRRKEEAIKRKVAKERPFMQFSMGSPQNLRGAGPRIRTSIGVTPDHAAALRAAGQPVPPPVASNLLIDTGAFGTLLRHEIAERAGLKLINANAPVHGIGVDTTGRRYLGSIIFAVESKAAPGARHNIVVNSEISSGDLPGDPSLDGLIGRDVLGFFEFHYDGLTGKFTLRYVGPR